MELKEYVGGLKKVKCASRIECGLALLSLVVACFAIINYRSVNQEAAAAFYGFSPTALMSDFWFRPSFSANFPGGEEELLRSLALQLSPLMGHLGFGKNLAFRVMVGLEIAVLATGGIFATGWLNRFATLPQALCTGIFLFASTLASCNLARWGHPYFGSVYNYAYGTGLLGVALVATNRSIAGAAFIGISIAIHPILGVMFGVCCAGAVLSDIRAFGWLNLLLSAAVFLAVVTPWAIWSLPGTEVSAAGIPPDAFIELTRMMGYHWYPISQEIFGRLGYERFAPFLGFLILIALYLFHDRRPLSVVERRIASGLAGLMMVSIFGIFASEYSGSPLIAKLALHRATVIILLIGSLFVVPGLLNDAMHGSLWRAVPAVLILAAPFFAPYGMPVILPLCLGALVTVLSLYGKGGKVGFALPFSVGIAIVGLGWLGYGGYLSIEDTRYTGANLAGSLLPVLALALLILRFGKVTWLAPVVVGVGAVLWAPQMLQFKDARTLEKATAYLEVERWANEHTPPDALFMLDPGHAYGWREFSERPSFGSLREWLYAAWCYNSRGEIYQEGLRRFAFYGMDIDEARRLARGNPDYGKTVIPREIRDHYYGAALSWFETAAATFGVDYFVFDESMAHDVPGLEVIFRNKDYTVRKLSGATSLSPRADQDAKRSSN